MGGAPVNADEEARSFPSDHEDISRPATGFTAVNGRASPGSQAKQQQKQQPDQAPETERKEGPEASRSRPSFLNHHESSSPLPPPSQTVAQKDSRQVNGSEAAKSSAPPNATGSPPAPGTTTVNSTTPHASYPQHTNPPPVHRDSPPSQNGGPSPTKRKRSLSQERGNLNGPIYPGNAPPPSPVGHRMSVDGGSSRERDPYGRSVYSPPHESYPPPPNDGYPPPPSEGYGHHQSEAYPPPPHHSYPPPPRDHSPSEIYPRHDRHPPPRSEYEHPVDPSIAPAPRPYYSDAHLAETLQRENRSYDNPPPNRGSYGTPEEEDEQQGQYGEYNGSREGQSGSDMMNRGKRKRIFSNRTKTGCMTCRRRKKKCDEQHPECNNCLRGGFMCEGYSARNTWQKPANTKQPIPLQSKNGYASQTPNRAPYPPVSHFDTGSDYSGPPPSHRASYDGGRPGPMPIEEDRDPAYSRPEPKSQSAWNKSNRPYPSNPPQASKYQGEGEHRGSIYEMPPESADPHSMPPPPHDSRNGSSHYSSVHGSTPPNHNNVQAAAQAALTHPASARPVSSGRREDLSERDRMLKGLYYYPNTPALVADRENCIQAIWRFNNATNPSHGVSPEERMRLFRAILTLRPTPEPPLSNGEPAPSTTSLPFGQVGERVIVEAPFHCDYGYNITVGDDVLIGADCRISDTCAVNIGARCIFSPNVKLICATYPIDPKRRAGSRGPALGRNIVIEEDCWIGANVTILAGVRVGKSSTVGAGSLLHQDVPRFTVVAGNPAKVSRGIYDGDA